MDGMLVVAIEIGEFEATHMPIITTTYDSSEAPSWMTGVLSMPSSVDQPVRKTPLCVMIWTVGAGRIYIMI